MWGNSSNKITWHDRWELHGFHVQASQNGNKKLISLQRDWRNRNAQNIHPTGWIQSLYNILRELVPLTDLSLLKVNNESSYHSGHPWRLSFIPILNQERFCLDSIPQQPFLTSHFILTSCGLEFASHQGARVDCLKGSLFTDQKDNWTFLDCRGYLQKVNTFIEISQVPSWCLW